MSFKRYIMAIGQSFYSPPLYRDVLFKWRHGAWGYLAIVSLIMALLSSAVLAHFLNFEIRDKVESLITQAPHFYVENGVARIEPAGRRIMTDEMGDPVVLMDLPSAEQKGETRIDDVVLTPPPVVVLPDRMIFYDENGMVLDEFLFSQLTVGLDIPQDKMMGIWEQIRIQVPIAAVFFMFILEALRLGVMAVMVMLISFAMTAMMKIEGLNNWQRFRLGLIAVTPITVLERIVFWALDIPVSGLAAMGVSLMYAAMILFLLQKGELTKADNAPEDDDAAEA